MEGTVPSCLKLIVDPGGGRKVRFYKLVLKTKQVYHSLGGFTYFGKISISDIDTCTFIDITFVLVMV